MVMKAGATNHDKSRIRKLLNTGYTPEQISALTRVRPSHVAAITKQIQAGTLKIGGSGRKADYGHGENDGKEEQIEQAAAVGMIEDSHSAEVAEMQKQINAANQRADDAEANKDPVVPEKTKPGPKAKKTLADKATEET
jgi:hypothetical protein